MKVLTLVDVTDRSEIFLHKSLKEAGVDLEIVCSPSAHAYDSFPQMGIPVTRLSLKSRIDLSGIRTITEKLRNGYFDIAHAATNRTLSNVLLASRGTPIKHIAYRGTIGHLSRLDPASWLVYLNPRVDKIVCVSNAVREYLLSLNIPPSRLVTIYKGHDISWYTGHKAPELSKFGIPPDAFIVGFTGSMRPVKGVDVLIQSALHLPEHLKIHFLLVGEVHDRKIEKLARNKKIRHMIHLAGFREDAPALAGACNVFVMPSIHREGLPRAVIEAMAQGVPAIATNVGGMPELVVDQENGLIVPPRDPQALARAVLYFAEDPSRCRVFGKHAQERIRTHFNIQTTIKQTIQLYEEVLNDSIASDPYCKRR